MDLDTIPTNGYIAGFFQLANTTNTATEGAYQMKKEMRGYFLVVTRAVQPSKKAARWQLIGISKGENPTMTVFPSPTTYRNYLPCQEDAYLHKYALAGFESCTTLKNTWDRLRQAPDTNLFQWTGLFENALGQVDEGIRVTIKGGAIAPMMWTTCHMGCCRAEL